MKIKNIFATLFILIAATTAAFAQTRKSPVKQPKTALDLFAILPAEFMTGTKTERLGTKKRPGYAFQKSIKADSLNFMLFEGMVPKIVAGDFAAPEGSGSMRVYRGKGRTIIGLNF